MTRDRRLSWINGLLLPLFNVLTAFLATGIVFLFIGVDPIEATKILLYGALGYDEGLGYTLYYATNFVFTGLAVAVAFHAGLFNIGGEGQAYVGGLGTALVALYINPAMSAWLIIPLGIIGGLTFGALWAFIPGYLQAYKGSHIVITTIMFNFLASALMVYLLVHVLREVGQMSPQSKDFPDSAWIPFVHEVLGGMGIQIAQSPLNLSILIALIFSVLVWFFLWHTRWGFAIRAAGKSNEAAIYSGIDPKKIIVVTMCISGALAGLVGINELMGIQHRLFLNFNYGYGFGGIAVALMGRNHPVGILIAAFLFGILYQGGAELDFELQNVSRDIVVVMQGLVILFCGGLQYLYRPVLIRYLAPIKESK